MVMGMGTSVPLGQATGQIVIDVASVKQAVTYIEQASKQIATAFQQVNVAVAQTAAIMDRGAQSITRSFQNIGREATSISRAGASVTSLGKNIAESIRTGEKAVQTSATNINRSLNQMVRNMPSNTGLFNQFFEAQTGTNLRDQVREMEKASSVLNEQRRRASGLTQTIGNTQLRDITSQIPNLLERARIDIETEGALLLTEIANSLPTPGMLSETQQFVQRYEALGQQFSEAGRAFAPVSIAAGVLVGVGIKTASDLEQLEIRFRSLEGSTEAAAAQMATLTDEARRFGLPVTETLAALARLSPVLKTTGNDTERFVGLVARLVALNPQQGFEGAAIAVSEALSGTGNDFRSLQERFNIPRNLLRQAIAETSNFADALDLALNRLGTTEQSALAVGQSFLGSFRRAKDEAMRLLAAGLRPILDNGITPLLQGLANIAQFFNENLRSVSSIAGSFLIMATAISPVLLVLGQMATLLARVRAMAAETTLTLSLMGKTANINLTALLGTLGRVGAGALVAAAGLEVGLAGYRAGQSLSGEENVPSQEETRTKLAEVISQAIGIVAASLQLAGELLATAAIQIFQRLGTAVELAVNVFNTAVEQLKFSLAEALYNFARDVNLPGFSEPLGARALLLAYDADVQIKSLEEARTALTNALQEPLLEEDVVHSLAERARMTLANVYNAVAGLLGGPIIDLAPPAAPDAGMSRRSGFGFSEDEIEAFRRYQEGLADLEESYGEQRRQVMENLHRQLVDLQERYEDQVAKLQDTEMRRREKAQRDLDKSIADIQEDSAEDQKKAYKDLQDEIAKILRDSRITVLEAASRLDARAIFEEQRRTRQRLDDLNKNYTEEQAERQKQTEDRIQQMRDDFALEEQERRADFDRRMAELAAENAKQRARMVADGQRRLDDLEYQNRLERNRRQNAFITELNDLNGHLQRVRDLNRIAQYRLEADLAAWVTRMSQAFTRVQPYVVQTSPYQQVFPGQRIITQYAGGTSYVPMTGAYKLHQGEGVLDPTTNALLRAALGGSYNMAEARRMFSGGGSGVNIDMRGVTVPIYGDIGGYNERDIQRMFSGALDEFFSQAAVRIQM